MIELRQYVVLANVSTFVDDLDTAVRRMQADCSAGFVFKEVGREIKDDHVRSLRLVMQREARRGREA